MLKIIAVLAAVDTAAYFVDHRLAGLLIFASMLVPFLVAAFKPHDLR